jgi:3-mercaptopyruvate sulfurtransferase SseA
MTKVYEKGHIPGTLNLPFTDVLNEDRSFKTDDELIKVF